MDYTGLLYELVSIYSPSGKEQQVSERIRKMLSSDLEADQAYIDEVGNVIGVYEGRSPSILLCGHIDTVPGELPVKRDSYEISGRGAVDAKSSMASFLCAAYELKKASFQNRIFVIGVVGEEDRGDGIKHLIRGGLKPSYAVFGEPSSSTNIVIGYRGGIRVKFFFQTESFHASSPWMGKSAVEAALELWAFIKKYNEVAIGKERKFDTVSSCLTQIIGGESHNMSPSNCVMTVDIRFPPSITSQEVLHQIGEEASKVCDHKIDFKMVVEDFTPAYTAPVNSELVTAFRKAIKEVKGTSAKLVRKTGSGDMNVFGKEVKVPVITYGPGDPKLSHTPNERISITEYVESIKIIKQALMELCKQI
ncbi:MAG: M20/M25/M40 family metallo-hydrolase [Nitrososphaeria archaeon]